MVTAIIPIMLTVGVGFALEWRRSMEVRTLSSISIYVLLPCLIFHSLLTTELTVGEAMPLIGVIVLTTAALWVLGMVVARARGFSREDESIFLLSTMFMNCGNMGLPVALYAYGDRGLELAIVWVIILNGMMNTLGVYYASRHRGGARQTVQTVLSLPSIYAAGAALVMRGLHVTLPDFLMPPLYLLGRSLIPVAQLLLGIQLAKSRGQIGCHLGGAIGASFARLVVGPAITFGLLALFGIRGLTAEVAVLLAGAPTAVNIAVYATEFGLQPRRVATVVFISTVASFATMSGLLFVLGRYEV